MLVTLLVIGIPSTSVPLNSRKSTRSAVLLILARQAPPERSYCSIAHRQSRSRGQPSSREVPAIGIDLVESPGEPLCHLGKSYVIKPADQLGVPRGDRI
jgi:hypothetical protein